MNQRELYSLFNFEGIEGDQARELLNQRSWYTHIVEFDPRTGNALPIGFDDVLRHIVSKDPLGVVHDRLWRITDHSRDAIRRIINSLNYSPKRDQATLPLRSVQELNAASFIALSRRPGRNIREKLGARPYMQAVRRYQSLDLPENRLFKSFLIHLVELLELRAICLGDQDELVSDIHRWLKSDQASEISQWQNLPANNTLLSHRDYRSIWDAWRWLQRLDDDLDADTQALEERRNVIDTWEEFARKFSEGKTLFGSVPVLFDYESFAMDTWCTPIQITAKKVERIVAQKQKFTNPACIDLTRIRPVFATQDTPSPSELSEQFVWQYWKKDSVATSIELFNADLVVEHPDAVTVTFMDLFFGGTVEPRTLNAAARSFSQRLSSIFTNPVLQWLYPDSLNDFELGLLRRNLNSRFPAAEPLPRSVAAVFEAIDYAAIDGDGFRVVVYDESDGIVFATKLEARFDSELLVRLPLTNGYYWERTPTIVLSRGSELDRSEPCYSSVDQSGQVKHSCATTTSIQLQEGPLLQNKKIGECDVKIIVNGSPVLGGVRLRTLQQQAGDIPLWRDQIPELSIKAIVNGLWETIPLVSEHTKVRPIRGKEVDIPIPEESRAPLGPGVPKFEFELFQGRSENRTGFEAFLTSPIFPLSSLTQFRMKLTYTYGADDPYKLQFLAAGKDGRRDSTIPPIFATWRPVMKRTDSELESLPLPDFEEKVTWDLLTRWPSMKEDYRTGRREWDLLEHIEQAFLALTLEGQMEDKQETIDWKLNEIKTTRIGGTVGGYNRNENGKFFVIAEAMGETIYCNERNFIEGVNPASIRLGDQIFFNINRSSGRPQGQFVTFSGDMPHEVELSLRTKLGGRKTNKIEHKLVKKKVYGATFPSHIVWNRGRSITEYDCPPQFRNAIQVGRERAQLLHDNGATPVGLRKEIFKFLSRMHKDAPRETIINLERISQKTHLSRMELQCLAWSLGDCSEPWQKSILARILDRYFSETTYVLSIAFLKCPSVVSLLTLQDLKSLLLRLVDELEFELSTPSSGDGVQRCAYIFEVLLALLFTRQSEDLEVKRILSPDSEFGMFFTGAINQVARIVRDNNFTLHSRIELTNSSKAPDEEWQPDLLVALRERLTGSKTTSALRISWSSESGDTELDAEGED
jgi:hypothetical protein